VDIIEIEKKEILGREEAANRLRALADMHIEISQIQPAAKPHSSYPGTLLCRGSLRPLRGRPPRAASAVLSSVTAGQRQFVRLER
jgi:hypothetical protein